MTQDTNEVNPGKVTDSSNKPPDPNPPAATPAPKPTPEIQAPVVDKKKKKKEKEKEEEEANKQDPAAKKPKPGVSSPVASSHSEMGGLAGALADTADASGYYRGAREIMTYGAMTPLMAPRKVLGAVGSAAGLAASAAGGAYQWMRGTKDKEKGTELEQEQRDDNKPKGP